MSAATDPGLPGLPVTFRPNRTRAVVLAAGAVLFTVLCTIAAVLDLGAGERATFVLTACAFLAAVLLLSRPKVVVDEAGVTVVNFTTRRRLAWAEIVRVNLRPGDPWVYLDLADGTSLAAMGIQPGIARQRALRDARALRAYAEARGTGRETGRETGRDTG